MLFPSPFIGWNNVDRRPVRYVAFFDQTGLNPQKWADFHVSEDGLSWRLRKPEGDLGRNGEAGFGHFLPGVLKRTSFGHLLGGMLYRPDNLNLSEPALFVSALDDGVRWKRVLTGLEGVTFSAFRRRIHQITEANSIVTVAISDGMISWTDDLVVWNVVTVYNNPSTLPQIMTLDASADKIVASVQSALANEEFHVANGPAGPWGTATPPFGNNTLADDIEVGNVFAAVNGTQIRTAPLTAAPWTVRSIPSGFGPNRLLYGDDRWLATNSDGGLITSPDAVTTWAAVGNGSGGVGALGAWLHDGERWMLFWGNGGLSVGDYDSLSPVADSGLPNKRIVGAVAIG